MSPEIAAKCPQEQIILVENNQSRRNEEIPSREFPSNLRYHKRQKLKKTGKKPVFIPSIKTSNKGPKATIGESIWLSFRNRQKDPQDEA